MTLTRSITTIILVLMAMIALAIGIATARAAAVHHNGVVTSVFLGASLAVPSIHHDM